MPRLRIVLVALALLTALSAAGCASNLGTSWPVWAGGEPPGLPAASAAAPTSYPNVQETPPKRQAKLISPAEQAKLEAELTALRNRTNAAGEAQKGHAGEQGH